MGFATIDPIPKIKKTTAVPQGPILRLNRQPKFKLKLKRRRGTQPPMPIGTAPPQTLEE